MRFTPGPSGLPDGVVCRVDVVIVHEDECGCRDLNVRFTGDDEYPPELVLPLLLQTVSDFMVKQGIGSAELLAFHEQIRMVDGPRHG